MRSSLLFVASAAFALALSASACGEGASAVCCPLDEPGCGCIRLGGAAPPDGVCPSAGVCDVPAAFFTRVTDDRGCPALAVVTGAGRCGGGAPPRDAGAVPDGG